MNIIRILCLSILGFNSTAQRVEPDVYPTSNGDLIVQPILHGTVVFTWNAFTIYVDPYGGGKLFAGIKKPDLVIITDIHGDHHNQQTLDELDLTSSTFIVPPAVAEKLPESYQIISLKNADSATWKSITIKAIPMYNLPETADSRHPKGRGNGYLITLGDRTIYISGDTEDIPEMRELTGIDIAFVCMNQPFTMNINQAASAVNAFKPKIVYPFHYRGQGDLSDTEAFKALVNAGNPQIEVKLRNWYQEN